MTEWLSSKPNWFDQWRLLPVTLALNAISAPALACPTSDCRIGGDNNNNNCIMTNNGCIAVDRPAQAKTRPADSTSFDKRSFSPRASDQRICRVIIEYPNHMEFGVAGATCDQNGMLTGHQNISITADLAVRDHVTFTFDSTFVSGRLSGQTSIQTDAGLSFVGRVFEGGRAIGRTVGFDGSIIEGETRDGVQNLTGTLTRPGQKLTYFINGREVSAPEFAPRNISTAPPSGSISSDKDGIS
jgi:hypothetical protein